MIEPPRNNQEWRAWVTGLNTWDKNAESPYAYEPLDRYFYLGRDKKWENQAFFSPKRRDEFLDKLAALLDEYPEFHIRPWDDAAIGIGMAGISIQDVCWQNYFQGGDGLMLAKELRDPAKRL